MALEQCILDVAFLVQWTNQQGLNNQADPKGGKGRGKVQVKNGGICLQWSQKGSCSRGSNCPWKHE